MTRTEIPPEFDPALHPIGFALAVELSGACPADDPATTLDPATAPDACGDTPPASDQFDRESGSASAA